VGFAHGFLTRSAVADVIYKQTGYYDPALERSDVVEPILTSPCAGHSKASPCCRPRTRAAPRLADIAGRLAFTYEV